MDSESKRIFQGIIDSVDATTYIHVVAPVQYGKDTLPKIQGIPLSAAFANLFGFKESFLIPAGSKVLCYSIDITLCYIIGIVPDPDVGVENFPNRTILGAGDAIQFDSYKQNYTDSKTKSIFNNINRPTDVVEGERVIGNDFGVLLGLFQLMVSLKASDLAQVQCHLLDDMVRIISHNFEHYTALGQFKVFHDGSSISGEFQAYNSPAESLGTVEVEDDTNDSVFESTDDTKSDDSVDFYKIDVERQEAIARFKVYLGKLGDFFNVFLSRPVPAIGRALDGKVPDKFDTGLFQSKLSEDGGLYIRSRKEIFVEKTNWIRVPTRIRTPEDPKGDTEDISFEKKELFEFDNSITIDNNPYGYFLQLRDYAAYVSEKVNYQTIKEHKKDFVINDEFDKEETDLKNISPTTTTSLQDYTLSNSGIYLMQNGGVMIKDAWGSAIVLEGGDIYLQAADSVVAQPLRNFIVKAGQYVSVTAKQDIDLSSTDKGFRVKTELAQYLYSDKSGIILESNGEQVVTASPDGEAVEFTTGIVLKGNKGIFAHSDTGVVALSADQGIIGKSKNDIRWFAGRVAQFTGVEAAVMNSSEDGGIVMNGTNLLIVCSGECVVGGQENTVLGQKDVKLGIGYDPNSPFVDVLSGAIDLQDLIDVISEITVNADDAFEQAVPFITDDEYDKIQFRFLGSDKYNLPDGSGIPMTIAQQESELKGLDDLTAWEEKKINETLPFPGADKFETAFISLPSLKNVEYKQGKGFINKADSTNAANKITKESLQKYKVK